MRLIVFVIMFALTVPAAVADDWTAWSRFRGPNGTGVVDETGLPETFGPEENVVWKTDLPRGHSSPIFGKDSIFVTAYEEDRLLTYSLDRDTGRVKWRREVERAHEGTFHKANSPASPSPTTDGSNVFVFFGERGMLAYGPDGNELWRVELGPFNNPMGMGASPVYVDGKVIQICDSETGSFMLAVDAKTGQVAWRHDRPEAMRGFSTPVLWDPGDGTGQQFLIAGSYQLEGHSVETGDLVWFVRSLTWQLKPTPVIDGDIAYVLGWAGRADLGSQKEVADFAIVTADHDANKDGFLSQEEVAAFDDVKKIGGWDNLDLDRDGLLGERDWRMYQSKSAVVNSMQAIRLGGKGNMTKEGVVWQHYRTLPNVPSPLLYEGIVYLVKDGGIVTALDAASGDVLKQGRLREAMERYFASPVAADGKIFAVSEAGNLSVIRPGKDWDVEKTIPMGDSVNATPVILDGKIYVRTWSALYCFGDGS